MCAQALDSAHTASGVLDPVAETAESHRGWQLQEKDESRYVGVFPVRNLPSSQPWTGECCNVDDWQGLKVPIRENLYRSGLLIWLSNDKPGMEEQDLSSSSSATYLSSFSSFKMFPSVCLVGCGDMCDCQRTICDLRLELRPLGLVMSAFTCWAILLAH